MTRRELLVFEVAGVNLAIDLALVEEVVPRGAVTPVPDSPPFLLGLTAVRGKVMGVIDASRRYGIGPALGNHLLVCLVRGNLTAIAVDRPVVAGDLPVRELSAPEARALGEKSRIPAKFLRRAFEVFEQEEGAEPVSTERQCLEIDVDLFVSAEMASRVAEA